MDDASSTEAKSASNAKRRADPVRVCIGIPTFKRPAYLKLLLRSLEKQQTQAAISIVVADNDPKGGEGIAACTALIAEGYNHTLTAVGAPVPGIAATRNMIVQTALQQSGVDYVAMIDDDSWPEPNWIEALLDLREKFQVDVVRAAMRPDFEIAPEPWLARTGYFQSSFTETGRVDQIHAGGNFLARAEVFRAVESPWFSPDFALTGGEDDDFFLRLKELGYTFAQSMESTVHERMPAARCSAGWLKQRALMNGTSWANIRMRLATARVDTGLGDDKNRRWFCRRPGYTMRVLLVAPQGISRDLPDIPCGGKNPGSAQQATAVLQFTLKLKRPKPDGFKRLCQSATFCIHARHPRLDQPQASCD